MKGVKILLKKKKTESESMDMSDIKILQKMKNIGLLSTERDILKREEINICYKSLKKALSYPFIQTNPKISFLKKYKKLGRPSYRF